MARDKRVTVTVSGDVGVGKSFIYTEIMLAMKAIGIPVEHADSKAWQRDIRMTGTEADREMYKPTVVLREVIERPVS